MTALVRRGWLWAVTFGAALLGGLLVVGCLALATGCGAAQKTVSAVASAAVIADDSLSEAYEIQALEAADRVNAEGGSFEDWCIAVREAWENAARASCVIRSVADLAIMGQHAIDAGQDLDAEWAGAACAALQALEAAWGAADANVPPVVGQAADLVCALADGARHDPPSCADPGPPPPCVR